MWPPLVRRPSSWMKKGALSPKRLKNIPSTHQSQIGAEQNPEDWWTATKNSIRRVLQESKINHEAIEGIGLTGQMHGLVLIDRNHEVLRPSILWCDQRTSSQWDQIMEAVGRGRVVELTYNIPLPGFTAPKILWVRENEPRVYEKSYKALLPKDYIRFRLTGAFATEVSDASGTALFDVRGRKWSDELLEELNVPRDLMPEVFESPAVSGKVFPDASKLTGLKAGTPVVGGAGIKLPERSATVL